MMDTDSARPLLRTVGCFMEYQGTFLILRRHPRKPDGHTWGLPAGKVDSGEDDAVAMIRELAEETGYQVTAAELERVGTYCFSFPDLRLIFPTYRIKLRQPVRIRHQPTEHIETRWVTGSECFALPDLIRGFHDMLRLTGYVSGG